MIVVTGCSEFIGFHLSNKLLKNNKKVLKINSLNLQQGAKKIVNWFQKK